MSALFQHLSYFNGAARWPIAVDSGCTWQHPGVNVWSCVKMKHGAAVNRASMFVQKPLPKSIKTSLSVAPPCCLFEWLPVLTHST